MIGLKNAKVGCQCLITGLQQAVPSEGMKVTLLL